ncbi:MAG: hypothetical protein HYW80_00445 [Parcubacteria group bacterium]|nr:hypothetical protein [Parcubacteria group bacterium]
MEPRQEKILTCTIREYIDRMEPVASRLISRKYHLGVSPATVRNEFLRLTEEGYLQQPHTSAGRLPTNQGWKYFVERVVLDEPLENINLSAPNSIEDIAEEMAAHTDALGVCINEEGDMELRGHKQLFSQPDFEDREQYERLAATIERLEKNVEEIFQGLTRRAPNIFIGEENHYFENDEISSLFDSAESDSRGRILTLLIGPKRMHYEKNWNVLRNVHKLLEENRI